MKSHRPNLALTLLPWLVPAFAGIAAAQDPLLARIERPLLVVECDGPAAWADAFAGTRLGSALASTAMRDALAPVLALAEREMSDEARTVFAELADGMAYDGRITLVLTWPAAASTPVCIVSVGPSRNADFDVGAWFAKAEELGKRLDEDEARPIREVDVDGRVLRVDTIDDVERVMPFELHGHHVTAIGPQAVNTLIEALLGDPLARPTRAHAPLSMQLDAGQLRERLLQVALDEDADPSLTERVVEMLGLASLTTIDLDVRAADEDVETSLRCTFDPAPTGVFEVFVPRQDLDGVLAWIPRDAAAWSAQAIRLDVLYRLAGELLAMFEPEEGLREIEQRMLDETGVRLKEEIIDRVTGNFGTASSRDAMTVEVEESGMSSNTWVLELDDGEAFGRTLEKLVRKAGLHAARKQVEFQGTTVSRIQFMMIPIEYAVTADALFLSMAGGAQDLRRMLTMWGAQARGDAPPPFPPRQQALLDASGRPVFASYTNLAAVAELMAVAMRIGAAEADPDAPPGEELQLAERTARELGRILEAHGADSIMSVGSFAGRVLVVRFRL